MTLSPTKLPINARLGSEINKVQCNEISLFQCSQYSFFIQTNRKDSITSLANQRLNFNWGKSISTFSQKLKFVYLRNWNDANPMRPQLPSWQQLQIHDNLPPLSCNVLCAPPIVLCKLLRGCHSRSPDFYSQQIKQCRSKFEELSMGS